MAIFKNLPVDQKIAFPTALVLVFLMWPSDTALFGSDEQDRPQFSSASPLVIDGDTIEIDGQRIRIVGIDAPDEPFVLKELAAGHLIALIEREGGVSCSSPSYDIPSGCATPSTSYERLNLSCQFVNQTDVGATMVAHGFAVDYREYSGGRFAELTRMAATGAKGLWLSYRNEMSELANARGADCDGANAG